MRTIRKSIITHAGYEYTYYPGCEKPPLAPAELCVENNVMHFQCVKCKEVEEMREIIREAVTEAIKDNYERIRNQIGAAKEDKQCPK